MLGKISQAVFEAMDWGRPYPLERDSGEPSAGFAVRIRSVRPGSVENPAGGQVVGFGNTCTHMGCHLLPQVQDPAEDKPPLQYRSPQNGSGEGLVCGPCPCHGTSFDLLRDGLVVLGPATQNLPRIELVIQNGDLVAQGWLGEADPREEQWPSS